MPDPLITVPLPTITGRSEFFKKAVKAYEAHANVEMVYFLDGTLGEGWGKGADHAVGDYIHFGADDVEMHPGWWQQTIRLCDKGFLPAPRVLNTDGTLQSCGDWGVELPNGAVPEFTRGPFVSKAQWDALAPLVRPFLEQGTLYYTDNVFTWAGRKLGMETVVCRAYEYTHHLASTGRKDERMTTDFRLFQEHIRRHA